MKFLTGDEEIQSEIFDYSEGVSVLKKVVESEKTRRFFQENTDTGDALSLPVLSRAVEHAVVVPRFHDYDEAVAEVDRAVRTILESSSNISMETIIQNRSINTYLKSKQ